MKVTIFLESIYFYSQGKSNELPSKIVFSYMDGFLAFATVFTGSQGDGVFVY